VRRRVSQVLAGWRTGLPRPVLILQGGDALNYFGYGLVLPFEIIYLHQIRGFSTSTAGLVLATTIGAAHVGTVLNTDAPAAAKAVITTIATLPKLTGVSEIAVGGRNNLIYLATSSHGVLVYNRKTKTTSTCLFSEITNGTCLKGKLKNRKAPKKLPCAR